MKLRLLFILALLSFHSVALAHRLEPIGTELPYVVEKGRLVSEIGFDWNGFEKQGTSSIEIPIALEFSFIKDLQFELELPYRDLRGSGNSGIGDMEVGTRTQWLHQEKSPLNLSFGIAGRIPTGSEERGLGHGVGAIEPNIALGHWFGDRFHLMGNLGYEFGFKNSAGEREQELILREAFVTRLYENTLYLTEELHYVPEFETGPTVAGTERHDHLLLAPGLLIAIRHGVEFKTAFPFGLMSEDPDFSWRAQLSITFGEPESGG